MPNVYRHIRLDKNEPFYIGIGTHRRAHDTRGRSKMWNYITSKSKYEVEILFENVDWDFAVKKEIEFISLYGRVDIGTGTLVNFTSGGEGRPKHDYCKYQLFNTYNNIKKLISNKKYNTTICEEWLNDFISFNNWAIKNGWDRKCDIRRKNTKLGYNPENCFIERVSVPKYEYNGIQYTSIQLSKILGIRRTTFEQRIRYGWDLNKIINTPIKNTIKIKK